METKRSLAEVVDLTPSQVSQEFPEVFDVGRLQRYINAPGRANNLQTVQGYWEAVQRSHRLVGRGRQASEVAAKRLAAEKIGKGEKPNESA